MLTSADFGPGFDFQTCQQTCDERIPAMLMEGKRIDEPERCHSAHVAYFLGRKKYPWVLRLSRDIPTFDSGDREYDSWHDLYIIREEGEPDLLALYVTGGYRVASIFKLGRMTAWPEDLAPLLQAHR